MELRIGNGYDIHRLVPGRPLILGGQRLDHPAGLGLDGHSDADVLVHAVMDALLGALSLGDIGRWFPPDDPRWLGADSLQLLEQVVALVTERGWQVLNVDSVVVAERPKLRPHIEAMRAAIASRMGLAPEQAWPPEWRWFGIGAREAIIRARLGVNSGRIATSRSPRSCRR
jgi:2-C-methyl-D-erythritol 2,4-cyclodiphosphate synthase